MMEKTFFIKTFGCQQNVADSERLATYYRARGLEPVGKESEADVVIINSCMIREKAEERVYGYIRNLRKAKSAAQQRIVLTGCIVGAAAREPDGKIARKLKKRIPDVELLPMEEVGFEYVPERVKNDAKHAWTIISSGCNNYCAFCIVPFARGGEKSRPFEEIVEEVRSLAEQGYRSITLLGQNVNSYGADLIKEKTFHLPDGRVIEPVWVKHLGRRRIPTLFPYLLEEVAHVPGIERISFTSSNPWDFSDELIEVCARNENIDRLFHLPVQAGSDKILKKMNRWYTAQEYLDLLERIRRAIPEATFATDIIVGFPGETEQDFEETVKLCRQAEFVKAFVACYSPRPGTVAAKNFVDDVPHEEKKRRFEILNQLVNVPNLGVGAAQDWIRTRERNRVT